MYQPKPTTPRHFIANNAPMAIMVIALEAHQACVPVVSRLNAVS
jgi:hypothetical protein